ncbi:MAG: murein L,D-transpeptidase, partial [Candidatus Hodarchaeota archaeon]
MIAKKGGWPIMPAGPALKKGARGNRVAILRALLKISGDLDCFGESPADFFGDAVEQAVRKFQKRHGLEVDGIVGPITLSALNVPVEKRMQQIRLNMERWREFPYDFGRRYILINTANYELKVVEDGQTIIKRRAIVGRPDRPTPVFSGEMTYLVINPYWYVPSRIATEDILPKIKANSDYLIEQKIRVFEVVEDQIVEVDRKSIDWSIVTGGSFPYKLRQEPGSMNALGRVKFMFPNRFSVYIHDTPARGLFEKTQRHFSSGCIRIEDPVDL